MGGNDELKNKAKSRHGKVRVRRTIPPSGHDIKPSFGKVDSGGSIPPNILEPEPPTGLLKLGNNAANDLYTERCKEAAQKTHPARFPAALPEFFIKLLTDEGGHRARSVRRVEHDGGGGGTAGAAVDGGGTRGGVFDGERVRFD